jgi:hypothetical protein
MKGACYLPKGKSAKIRIQTQAYVNQHCKDSEETEKPLPDATEKCGERKTPSCVFYYLIFISMPNEDIMYVHKLRGNVSEVKIISA